MIKEGSCWSSSQGNVFQVISRIEIDNHAWVYYRNYRGKIEDEVKEYSCYEESFLARFQELPECPKER
jgi:hypothetical protein